jgi:hypothetical protein
LSHLRIRINNHQGSILLIPFSCSNGIKFIRFDTYKPIFLILTAF